MSQTEVISKEFLEKALGKKVESFTIESHSDTGDNFMSILYTLDVNVVSPEGKIRTIHLLTKCYPNNAGRQEFLNSQNIFWKELQIYKSFIPEIIRFQEDLGLEEIVKPDFPPFAAGDAVNFMDDNGNENKDHSGKVFRPFDNYIMMVDLRKTWGYKMGDRHVGLDFDHMALVVEAQAKLHALSWAYKKETNITDIKSRFPTMIFDFSSEKDKQMFNQMITSNTDEGIGVVKTKLGEDSHFIGRLEHFKANASKISDIIYTTGGETDADLHKYWRIKPKYDDATVKSEIPWSVVLHGDSHMNNMLFRYNPVTNKPEKVILVDLQICRDGCPTMDVAYIFYTSTTTEFRKKHMDEILNIYYEKFTHFCNVLKTETLPGFTLPEFKRRFHRMKVFGLLMGTICMPIFLREKENAIQLDSLEGMTQEEIFVKIGKGMSENTLFAKRFTEFVQEMYDEGVL